MADAAEQSTTAASGTMKATGTRAADAMAPATPSAAPATNAISAPVLRCQLSGTRRTASAWKIPISVLVR